MGVIAWMFFGLFVGWVARFLVPGNSGLGCIGTIGLGVAGSLVGGTLGNLITGDGFDLSAAGFLGSVVGAVIVLLAVRKFGSKPPPQHT